MPITLAEDFGASGRGTFDEEVGALRDVVQTHLQDRSPVSRIDDAVSDPLDPAAIISAMWVAERPWVGTTQLPSRLSTV